jgi:hypothetical protein
MATSTVQAVYKLAMAGEQAGFTLEQMIQILNAKVSVETLLNWIELPFGGVDPVLSLDQVAAKLVDGDGESRAIKSARWRSSIPIIFLHSSATVRWWLAWST